MKTEKYLELSMAALYAITNFLFILNAVFTANNLAELTHNLGMLSFMNLGLIFLLYVGYASWLDNPENKNKKCCQ